MLIHNVGYGFYGGAKTLRIQITKKSSLHSDPREIKRQEKKVTRTMHLQEP